MMSEFIFLSSRLSFIFVSSSAVNENALRSNEFFFKSFWHFLTFPVSPQKFSSQAESIFKLNQFLGRRRTVVLDFN